MCIFIVFTAFSPENRDRLSKISLSDPDIRIKVSTSTYSVLGVHILVLYMGMSNVNFTA